MQANDSAVCSEYLTTPASIATQSIAQHDGIILDVNVEAPNEAATSGRSNAVPVYKELKLTNIESATFFFFFFFVDGLTVWV